MNSASKTRTMNSPRNLWSKYFDKPLQIISNAT